MRKLFTDRAILFLSILALTWPAGGLALHVTEPAYINGTGGLPQNSVRALLVDHENYLWVGTERGLARFDGHRFINFSEVDDRIPVDVLISLNQDSHGRIWTNWYKSNPRVILPDRSEVIELSPRAGVDNDLVESVNDIYEDPQGTVWFNGFSSVYWMEPDGSLGSNPLPEPVTTRPVGIGHRVYTGAKQGVILTDTRSKPPLITHIGLPPPPGTSPQQSEATVNHLKIWKDRLVICAPWGVYLLDPESAQTESVFSTGNALIGECRLQGNLLYLSRWHEEQLAYDLLSFNLETLQVDGLEEGLPALGFITNAFIDSTDGDWLVIDGELYTRGLDEEHFDHVELRAPIFGVMSTLAESRGGEIWIATDGSGLARIAPHRKKFTTVVPPELGQEVNSAKVRGMADDNRGHIWLGTEERGINRWTRATDAWRQYETDAGHPFKELVSRPDGTIFACNHQNQELVRYDEDLDRFVPAMPLPANHCKILALDDGNLLVASGPDLVRFDPDSQESIRLNRQDLPSPVRALAVDAEGNPWFGMHGHGLLRLDKQGEMRTWASRNSRLTSDQIFSLQFDANGSLWIGTWHGGLLRFDPETARFWHFGPEQGLPDSTIFGILIDDDQALWLSTYRGLVRFKPCSTPACQPETRVFNHFDGLQGDEFDAESFYKSPRGELFFGGSGGFNAFFPRDIHLNDDVPSIAITRAMLDGNPLPGSHSVYRVPSEIQLPYNAGELRIELSSMDYNAPGKNRYQYRGTDNGFQWTELEGPELVLRGLPEGRQKLEFRGSNNDGLWSDNTIALDLRVAPPLYRHPLMLLICAVLLVLMPLFYFRQRQARLVESRKRLARLVRERTLELERASSSRERFFANVSHEIAAPLHMILLMLEQQRERDKGEPGLYQSATGYAAQLLAYLRQLVDSARSLESDSRLYRASIRTIVGDLLDVNRPVASAREIQLKVGNLPAGDVAVYRHSAAGIFSNLLCNALIYTPSGGEISIHGECCTDDYRFVIENSAHPDHPVDLEQAMQRGQRGRFDSTSYGGHGLGLSIVTESVESLGGRISHETVAGKLRFNVHLPLADPNLPVLHDPADFSLTREQQLAIDAIDPAASHSTSSITRASGRKILIIEDDRNVARLLKSLLQGEYTVATASSCEEGIACARSLLPDVILCDLFLPDQSGFDVLRAVRENRMIMDTLFVMITASISEADREKGLRLGVDHYINKPVSAETIKWIIHNHEALERQRRQSSRLEELRQKARSEVSIVNGDNFEPSWNAVMEELFADPETTIEDFQVRLSLSYSVLVRHCREHFGKTPKRLLVETRVEKAREILLGTRYKVGIVAEMSGFSSHAQFATTFKRETGCSPAQYRKANRKRKK